MKVLEGASAGTLRAIGAALRNGQLGSLLSPLAIARVAPSCSETLAHELIRLSGEGMQASHLALLVDTMATAVEERLANCAELVWTGPESSVSRSRDTAVVVAELFRAAARSVLVSTFVVQQPETVFRALAERMEEVPASACRYSSMLDGTIATPGTNRRSSASSRGTCGGSGPVRLVRGCITTRGLWRSTLKSARPGMRRSS